MAGLPPLGERVQEIRSGKAATNASDNDKNFARSQVRVLLRAALAIRAGWEFGEAACEGRAVLAGSAGMHPCQAPDPPRLRPHTTSFFLPSRPHTMRVFSRDRRRMSTRRASAAGTLTWRR